MVQIIEGGFGNFGSALGAGLAKGLGAGIPKGVEFAQQMALKKQSSKAFAQELKALEKTQAFTRGLETLDAMEAVKNRGKIGRGSGLLGFLDADTRRDRAEYEQLGKSLIPIVAAGVPIRNQREFDEYKKVLADASASDDEIQGAIDGLRQILKSQIGNEDKDIEESSPSLSLKKVSPGTPITQEVIDALKVKTKNNKKKAMQVAKELGYDIE